MINFLLKCNVFLILFFINFGLVGQEEEGSLQSEPISKEVISFDKDGSRDFEIKGSYTILLNSSKDIVEFDVPPEYEAIISDSRKEIEDITIDIKGTTIRIMSFEKAKTGAKWSKYTINKE